MFFFLNKIKLNIRMLNFTIIFGYLLNFRFRFILFYFSSQNALYFTVALLFITHIMSRISTGTGLIPNSAHSDSLEMNSSPLMNIGWVQVWV